jgi:hypothetical protein
MKSILIVKMLPTELLPSPIERLDMEVGGDVTGAQCKKSNNILSLTIIKSNNMDREAMKHLSANPIILTNLKR